MIANADNLIFCFVPICVGTREDDTPFFVILATPHYAGEAENLTDPLLREDDI